MMLIKKYLFVVLLFIGVVYNSHCEKIRIVHIPTYLIFGSGLTIHEDINLQNDFFETHPYQKFEKITSELGFGILIEFNIFTNPIVSYDIGIQGIYRYSNFNIDNWGSQTSALIPDSQSDNNYSEGMVGTMYNVNIRMHNLELTTKFRMRFNTTYPFGFVIGPSFTFPFSTNMEENIKLVIPSNSIFNDSIKYRLNSEKNIAYLYNGKIKNANNVLYGFNVGGFIEKNLGNNLFIMFELNYTHPINELIDFSDWYINKVNLMLGIKFQIPYEYFP